MGAEKSTARILQEIIQETTNRMNKLQCQESESEIQLFKIKGQIEEEKARSTLLAIQTEKVKRFLKELEADVPEMDKRISLWNVLRKREALHEVSSGNASLFFTPNDVDLTIKAER